MLSTLYSQNLGVSRPQASSPSDPGVHFPRLSSNPRGWAPHSPSLGSRTPSLLCIPTSQESGTQVPSSLHLGFQSWALSVLPGPAGPQGPHWGRNALTRDLGVHAPAPATPWSHSVLQNLCQAVCSSPRSGHQEAGELSLVAFSIRYRIKGAGRLGEGKHSPFLEPRFPALFSSRTRPRSTAPRPHGRLYLQHLLITINEEEEDRCQCQSLQGEQSRRLGQLPSASAGDGRESYFRSPWGKRWLLPKILSPEAHVNCHAFEGVGRGRISKTVVFNFSREDRAGNLDSRVPE